MSTKKPDTKAPEPAKSEPSLLEKLTELREFITKASTVQRMAQADKIAMTAIDGLIVLERRVALLEAGHAKGK